jgi:hypothetical protein
MLISDTPSGVKSIFQNHTISMTLLGYYAACGVNKNILKEK